MMNLAGLHLCSLLIKLITFMFAIELINTQVRQIECQHMIYITCRWTKPHVQYVASVARLTRLLCMTGQR